MASLQATPLGMYWMAMRLDQPDDEAAQHRAVDVADATQHGGGKGDQAKLEAGKEPDLANVETVEDASGARQRAADQEVSEIVRSMLTPISEAASGSCAVARIERPILVPRMKRSSANISATATTTIKMSR